MSQISSIHTELHNVLYCYPEPVNDKNQAVLSCKLTGTNHHVRKLRLGLFEKAKIYEH